MTRQQLLEKADQYARGIINTGQFENAVDEFADALLDKETSDREDQTLYWAMAIAIGCIVFLVISSILTAPSPTP